MTNEEIADCFIAELKRNHGNSLKNFANRLNNSSLYYVYSPESYVKEIKGTGIKTNLKKTMKEVEENGINWYGVNFSYMDYPDVIKGKGDPFSIILNEDNYLYDTDDMNDPDNIKNRSYFSDNELPINMYDEDFDDIKDKNLIPIRNGLPLLILEYCFRGNGKTNNGYNGYFRDI
jgi:hypothetical protein